MIFGRDSEREAIAALLTDARGGRGQVLVLQGEPGIGKSALLDDAVARATDMTVLRCGGMESEIDLPYAGLQQLLAPAGDRLGDLGAKHGTTIGGLRPVPRSATAVADPVITPGTAGPAVLAAWRSLAAQRPLLVVVDDAHWLDGESARAILFAARRLTADPVAVLIARRDLDRTDPFARTGLPVLPLAGLATADVRDLLAGQGWSPPRPAIERLTEHTGGNALALLELAATGDTGDLSAMASMARTVPLTDRLRDAFTDRLRTLPEPTRRALVVVAADDTGRPETVLAAMARIGLTADTLSAAETARLVTVGTMTASRGALGFRHPLMRSAVYHDAPFASRVAAHEALAAELDDHDPARAAWHRALAATGTDEQRAAALVHHAAALRKGGGLAASSVVHQRVAQLTRIPARRRHHLATAAYDAWKAGESARARSLARQAAAIPAGPPATDGTGTHDTDVALERLQGYIQWYAGDQMIAAARLADSVDDTHTAAPAETATLLLVASDAAWQAGEIATARSLAHRLAAHPAATAYRPLAHLLAASIDDRLAPEEDLGARLHEAIDTDLGDGDPRRGLYALLVACRGPDPTAARDLGLRVTDRLRADGIFGLLTVALSRLADIEFQLGHWEEGVAHAEEGLCHADDAEHQARQADMASHLARFAAVRADDPGLQAYSHTALTLAWRTRHRQAAARTAWGQGLLALATGDNRTAFEHFASLARPGPSAHPDTARKATADLVEAALRSGQTEAAERAVTGIATWARGRTSPWVEAQVLRCQALLAAHGEDPDADKLYARSASAAGLAQLPFEQARTEALHGEWLRRNRHPTQARQHLRTAVTLFHRLGASQWTEHARTQRRALGGAPDHRPAGLTGRLTPQELQVARLAAQGLSNREIGTTLFLSPRTVGYHLHKIFPKLGIARRAQLRHLDLG
ncbi:AAA family ATPase [Actinomadura sp. 9N407]|uniref:helix-turn-helix transcriptional regulator n=1 Tax=Actinomadura sp. 9N407 TaxID=3375154 RepID=UPI00379EA3E0